MKSRLIILLSFITALAISLTACGGSGSGGGSSIGVTFAAQPPNSLAAGKTVSLSANVTNDSQSAGVVWSASCASALCGSFNPESTPSGSSTIFEAPATIPNGNTVTITATSVTDATKSVAATITITTPSGISVSFASQPPASLVQGLTTSLIAVVSGDSHNAGVTWSVSCGSSSCGTFNPTSTPSNGATTYTAPSSVPAGNTVTVKATSVTDKAESAAATITITTPPPAVLSDGTYIYHLSGEDVNNGGSPYYLAGAFTVKDAVISGGEQDFVDTSTGQTDSLIPANCSLSTTSDGNIAIVLATNDPNIGVNGAVTIHGSKVSGSRVLVTEFDTFAAASGTLDLQTSTAAPSGGYAFYISGLDGSSSANALVMGGILNISGNAISVGESIFDYNDGGSVGQGQSFASGSVSAPDSFGRITMSLTPSSSSGVPQFGLSGYIIGSNRIELVENLTDSLNGVLGGPALGQGANTGKFSAASVAGQTYVFTAVGADINGLATFAGGFALNGNGAVGGNIVVSDLSVSGGPPIQSGNWVIGSNGRVTITNVTPSLTSPFSFQLYLDGNGNALELGVDSTQATAGPAYLQTSGAINPGSYALGAVGFSSVNSSQPVWSAAGPVTLDSSLNWSGFTDYNVTGISQTPNAGLSATTDTSTGLFQITGLDVTNSGADGWGFFAIDGSRTIAIEVDKNQLGALLIEAVNP